MLDKLAKFTHVVEIYLLPKTFKCKLPQLSKQSQAFHLSAGSSVNECQSNMLLHIKLRFW